MNTVNVIEYNETPISLRAFPDTKAGNDKAEDLFAHLVNENADPKPTQEDMEMYLENGIYSDENGYELYLTHSTESEPKWEDSYIQAIRLIAEIEATQEKLDIKALCESMDLEEEQLNELFNRLQMEWEEIKG